MAYSPLQQSLISTANSSITPLTGAAVFTGTSEDITQYAEVHVYVFSDVASGTNGLSMQQSNDGTNWDVRDEYTTPAMTAGQGKVFSVGRYGKFFRVVFTNGAGAQATFRLQTIYSAGSTRPSSVRPQDGRTNDNDMDEVLAYGMQYDPSTNTWNRAKVPDQLITGQATQTAAGQNIVLATAGTGNQDVTGYKSISIQIIPTGTVSSGVVTFEGSNDGTTFVALSLYDENSLSANPISTVSPATGVSRYFKGPLAWKFFRARISTVIGGGGSLQAITTVSQTPFTPNVLSVSQSTGANLNTVIASGTVTTVTTLTTLANGQTAHSSASTGSPVRVGGRVLPATPDLTLVAGDASDVGITTAQQVVTKDFGPAEQDYVFSGSITNSTTAVVFKNAAGASIRNYVTGLILSADTLGAASELVIKDGAIAGASVSANVFTSATHDLKIGDQIVFSVINTFTGATINTPYWVLTVPSTTTFTLSAVPNGTTLAISGTGTSTFNRILYRTKLQTTGLSSPATVTFTTPLRGGPNATVDIQTLTATVTGTVYYTAQGYTGF